MKKSFGALDTSINRYVAVFSMILLGFAVLLSLAMPASAASRGIEASCSFVSPTRLECNFPYCHRLSTRKSITFRRNVTARALPLTFSSSRYWPHRRVVV